MRFIYIILLLVLSVCSTEASLLNIYSVVAIEKDEPATNLNPPSPSFFSFPMTEMSRENNLYSYNPRHRIYWDYCESRNLRRPFFRVAIKNNLVYDAFTIPNLGIEIGFAPQWTIDISSSYDVFDRKNDSRMKHLISHAEIRFWPRQQFYGHFFGVHGLYGIYNIGGELPYGIKFDNLMEHRYEGSLYGAGVSYGYHQPLSKRWAIEGTVGFGYARFDYDQYRCIICGTKLSSDTKNYFGPTRIGISWMYIIG